MLKGATNPAPQTKKYSSTISIRLGEVSWPWSDSADPIGMGPEQDLLLHFWWPLAATPLAIALMIGKDPPRRWAGRLLGLAIFAAVILQPNPLSTSLEGWTLHIFLSILGPTLLAGMGLLVALFSGPISVAPLPRGLRPVGLVMILASVVWFMFMLFESRPFLDGLENQWWQHLVTSLLTISVIVSGFAAAFAYVMGDERLRESAIMTGLSLTAFGLLIYLLAEGTASDDPVFWRSASWGVLGDLAGLLVGGFSALGLFIMLVWLGEKNQPIPGPVEPLSDEERARVREILEKHVPEEVSE